MVTLLCVVPATNRPATLERALAAIRAAVDPPEELIVIEEPSLAGPLRGGRILLDPTLQGTHLKEWRLPDMVKTYFAQRGVPWVELLLERRNLPATLNPAGTSAAARQRRSGRPSHCCGTSRPARSSRSGPSSP